MALRKTTKSVDELLYSLGTSLQQFKGQNGLQRFINAGKLSLLSFVGDFEETHDQLFTKRTDSLSNTRRCLLTLNDLFEDVTRYATKMAGKVEQITKTLDQFHECCDLELDNPEYAENSGNAVGEEKLREMAKLSAEMNRALNEFCSSASTCESLNASTVAQLERVDKETSGSVGKAQTDFDAQRRRTQLKEDDVNRLRSGGNYPGREVLRLAEFGLQRENEALQVVGDEYFISLQEAMTSTSFSLEQTCMATWASSNVFFVQFGTFLKEFETRIHATGKLLIDIKNSQHVSKQIGVERAARLAALHPRGTVPIPAAAEAAVSSPTPTGNAAELENLFGPPVSLASTPYADASAPAASDNSGPHYQQPRLTVRPDAPGGVRGQPPSATLPHSQSAANQPHPSQFGQPPHWGLSHSEPSYAGTVLQFGDAPSQGQYPVPAPPHPSVAPGQSAPRLPSTSNVNIDDLFP